MGFLQLDGPIPQSYFVEGVQFRGKAIQLSIKIITVAIDKRH